MNFKKQMSAILFSLFISLTLSACGDDDAGEASASGDSSTDTKPPARGQYDLTNYLFHRNVLVSNGEFSFIEKLYSKKTGEHMILDLARKFTTTDGTFIEESSGNEVTKTYKINTNNIEETIIGKDNILRLSNRFADVGDVYQDASSTKSIKSFAITQNSRCTLLEHLDSFNLTSATGGFGLASGIYNDVLKVECITGFVSKAGVKTPHSTLRHYFAKDLGGVFSEGTMLFVGDAYIIEQH